MQIVLIIVLTIIESVITLYLMFAILDTLNKLPKGNTKDSLLRLFNPPVIAFVMNFGVSRILMVFTGAGMSAGGANLIASVPVAVIYKKVYSMRK